MASVELELERALQELGEARSEIARLRAEVRQQPVDRAELECLRELLKGRLAPPKEA